MLYWYVLHVKTGYEEKTADVLKRILGSSCYLPFVPMIEKAHKQNRVFSAVKKVIFPGYVFLQSESAGNVVLKEALPLIIRIKEIYKFLNYGEKTDIVMHENERIALEKLLGPYFFLEGSSGSIEEGLVRVNRGALAGNEHKIKKVNRHKREAVLEVDLMGNLHHITVALEIAEKN